MKNPKMKKAKAARKARELILLLEGTTICASFTNSTPEQLEQTVQHINSAYGRKLDIVKVREVLPAKRRGK